MARFLCTGNAVVDIMVRPVDAIRWGETTMVESLEQHVGGNGANTAFTLARLGNDVRLIAPVGNDALGDFVLSYLSGGGVDTSNMRRTTAPTGSTIGLVNAAGARTFLHCLGASGEILITPEEIAEAARGRAHYHLGAPFRLARMRGRQHHLLCAARAAGLKTSLDTQWDPDGKWMEEIGPCLPWADYFFANEDEFRMLAATDQPAEAARFLQRHGAAVVVLKLGARGCAVYTGTEEILCPALEVTVVDTTGAGDCFVGAFLDCVTRGVALREAARFACEISACSIQRLGATEGVPSRGT